MTDNNDDSGTVMIDFTDDMTFADIRKILTVVSDTLGALPDHSISLPGTMCFYDLSEGESDWIYDELCKAFGESYVQDTLSYCFDNNFEDEPEDEDEGE